MPILGKCSSTECCGDEGFGGEDNCSIAKVCITTPGSAYPSRNRRLLWDPKPRKSRETEDELDVTSAIPRELAASKQMRTQKQFDAKGESRYLSTNQESWKIE